MAIYSKFICCEQYTFLLISVVVYCSPIEGKPLLGALDMGGSSTQLIFYNGTSDARKIHADDFWSHSWLNYGVQRVHERVLNYILQSQDRIEATHERGEENLACVCYYPL